jgi:integrase
MAHIEKRSRNGKLTWRARYRTPAGVERSRSFERKVDAERFLASVENAKASGSYVDPSLAQLTIQEWAGRWLAGQAHVKPTTLERYEGIVRKHVLPKWGRVKLANVSHGEVQAWISELARDSSAATVQKVHRVLSLILDMAVKDGRLARNVASGVNLPRLVKPEHLYLSHDQVEELARECGFPSAPSRHAAYDTRSNDTYRLVVLFLAYTGVRFGEMAALRVKRLDLLRNRARIAESVTPVQGKGLVWGTPKTHERREVPIPPFLSEELTSLLEGKEPDDLVFAGIRNGEPLRVSTFSGSFKAAALAIGLPTLHPHQLRHTAASLAIAAGADVKVVQQMLGHASAAMTLDVYGHLFEDRLDEVGTAMHHARAAAQEARSSLTMAGGVDSDAAPARPQSPTADSGEKAEGPSALRFRSSEGPTDEYPRPDSNRRYRLERAAC